MAAKKKLKSAGVSGHRSPLDYAEIAIELSHAATFGVAAAAKQFGVNRKTIQRHQALVNSGKCPELSRLVATERERSVKRNRDKMQQALDVLLDRSIELAPTADLGQTVNAIEKIGTLFSSMKVMRVEFDGAGQDASGHAGLGRESEDESEARPPLN
jgi:hypothetical protein